MMKIYSGLLVFILADVVLAMTSETRVAEDNPTHTDVKEAAFTKGYDDKEMTETAFIAGVYKNSVTTSGELQTSKVEDNPTHTYVEETIFTKGCSDKEMKETTFSPGEYKQGVTSSDIKSGNKRPGIEGFTPLHNSSLNGIYVFDDTLKEPSYKYECKEGFTGNHNGTICTDIDECLSDRPCHQYANCTNTVGSYICTCWDGFKNENNKTGKQPGRKCTEINECNEKNSCSEFATCKNNVGSYTCECWDGYTDKDPGQPGTNCELVQRFSLDVECGELTHEECMAKAIKMFEDYCATNEDETCKNYKILDFDECAVGDKCPDGVKCLNTPGGYTCDCDEGTKYVEASDQCEKEVCYLGMKNGDIADEQISTSSNYDHQHGSRFARLDKQKVYGWNNGAWSALGNRTGEWIQINLGKATSISGLITQGRPTSHSQWVTKYKVQCGMGSSKLAFVDDGKEFIANKDMDSHVYNMFSKSIVCRYVRLYPTAWHKHISMRLELVKGDCGKSF